MKNYYEILEVSKTASKEVIEKVYKVLAKKYHPDMNQGENQKEAEEKFKDISEAYEVLMDDDKRKRYDEELKANEIKIANPQVVHDTEYIYVNKENGYEENDGTNLEFEEELKNQIEYQKQKAYNDAYIKSLKDMGYNIVYKKTLKEYLKSIRNLIIFIAVIAIICLLPPVNGLLKAWYESSPGFIKTFIEGLFK